MSFHELPKFETYEEASQIRRSIKSVKANIVEGYGRRRYKQDYLRFLTYAHAFCDETIDHLETLYETDSLRNEARFEDLLKRLNQLGGRLNRFIRAVESKHEETLLEEDPAIYNE